MFLSFSLIFLVGAFLGYVFKKIKLPGLIGMLIAGIILGPYALNLLDAETLEISIVLRKIALIIILMRAGLSLNFNDLIKVGRPAVLMCFVPACFEIVGMVFVGQKLLGLTLIEAAVLGTVIAAVSPAVVVPKMLKLMETGYGVKNSIPQMIMAGSSVDDIFVIVLFTVFTGLAKGENVSFLSFVQIPTSIIFGLAAGLLVGGILVRFFNKIYINDTQKVIILLSISFIFVTIEGSLSGAVGFSGLLAVMAMGAQLKNKNEELAKEMSGKFSKLWVGAEVLLFVLVGATVNISYAISAGAMAILAIFGALIFRMVGVLMCMVKTKITPKERLFSMIAYTPKATVQAAIGSIPLSMGLACGEIVLTVAVLAILITAPLGAFAIDLTYKRFLKKE